VKTELNGYYDKNEGDNLAKVLTPASGYNERGDMIKDKKFSTEDETDTAIPINELSPIITFESKKDLYFNGIFRANRFLINLNFAVSDEFERWMGRAGADEV
jgi:hypothetical protein